MRGVTKVLSVVVLTIVFSLGFALGNYTFPIIATIQMPIDISSSQDHIVPLDDLLNYTPEKDLEPQVQKSGSLHSLPEKRSSPKDRVSEKDIRIYRNRIMVDVEKAILARFTDTHSMEPVLNKDSNAIEITPDDPDDIQEGDIISYRSSFSEGTIIHRVVEKGIDEKGVYFRTKGYNLE
jgi:hypothetical protein